MAVHRTDVRTDAQTNTHTHAIIVTRITKYVGEQEALRRRSLAMGAGRADHDYASEFAVFNPRELSSIGTGAWAVIVVSPARLPIPLLQHI